MTNTTFASGVVQQQWQDKFFSEYVRDSRFKRYMGTDENKPIQMVMDLTKKRGDTITVQLVTRLTGSGVTGDSTLRGNEEALDNYNHDIDVNQLRNAVRRGTMEQQKSTLDILKAARVQLKLWAMEQLRDDIIARMLSPHVDGTTAYASASEANKDAWLAASTDRVLFGAAKSNNASDDHSAALAEIDSTNDTLVRGLVSLAKRMARDADPHIRPIRVGEDEEWYVLFANKWAFRDLKANLETLHSNGEVRGKGNPLWRDGDLAFDGVIVREIPEIGVLSGVGASSIDVAPNFLCGAQAIGVGWAMTTKVISEKQDYDNLEGVGVAEIRGVEKLMFNSVQHGMLTLYTSGVADT